MAEQLTFFTSLDFPGRTTLLAREIAERLGVSERHIEREIEEGALRALDLKGRKAKRAYLRVAIEDYRDYVMARFTGPRRHEAILALPEYARRHLIRELQESLKAS